MQRIKAIHWGKFLKSPTVILLSILLGVVIGVFTPQIVPPLAWLGNAYLSFLKLCALPIMLSAITSGINRLLHDKNSINIVLKLLIAVFTTFTVCNAIAIIISLIASGGQVDTSTLELLGNEVNKTGIDFKLYIFDAPPPVTEEEIGFSALLSNLISDNIFESLASGKTLEVLTFSIVFGTAISFLPESPVRQDFLSLIDFLFQTFNSIVRSSLSFLPISLLGLISQQVSETGFSTIKLMLNFVVLVNVCLAVTYLLGVLTLWIRSSRPSLRYLLGEIRETSILAVTTSNSFACLPSSLTMMANLKFNPEKVNSLLPINIITFRYGTSIYFVLATMFVLNLYQEKINFNVLTTVILGCILASLSSLGLVGIATLSCIEVVCRPLGLPVESVLLIFIAIDPLVNPLRVLVNVYASMMVTALVTDNHRLQPVVADYQPNLS